MSEGEGFLSRWSRRKRAGGGAAAAPASPPAAPVPPEIAAPPDARPAFDPADLPPIESLTQESDFGAFLREEVPAALRRAALRRAWSLDPAIRDFVGPADYAWDYNAPDGVPGFSLGLTGDMDRLIAQAIGLGEAPPVEPAEENAPPVVQIAGTPAGPAPLAGPSEDTPLLEAAVDGPAPDGDSAPDALSTAAAPAAEAPPVRRRHGGALPT